jgi:hypothetical protein
MNVSDLQLLSPVKVGALDLSHRVVLAPVASSYLRKIFKGPIMAAGGIRALVFVEPGSARAFPPCSGAETNARISTSCRLPPERQRPAARFRLALAHGDPFKERFDVKQP